MYRDESWLDFLSIMLIVSGGFWLLVAWDWFIPKNPVDFSKLFYLSIANQSFVCFCWCFTRHTDKFSLEFAFRPQMFHFKVHCNIAIEMTSDKIKTSFSIFCSKHLLHIIYYVSDRWATLYSVMNDVRLCISQSFASIGLKLFDGLTII